MKTQAYGCAALATFCLGISPVAQAGLKPISDDAMGEVTGQAFMQVENIAGEGETATNYCASHMGIVPNGDEPLSCVSGVNRLRTHQVDMGTKLF
ncbi:DUF6160 family protein [Marinobacter sp.]|uniref:DUF6160 family protein n=1 Tax=Marinobacter sp. TaxID=50741 RepID=UPI0025C17A6E|nr:DUF6160 family protein [Marinobacter sp.]